MQSNPQLFREYLKRRDETIEKENNNRENNLYNEITFYKKFMGDLYDAKREIIIFSPYIAKFRMDYYKKVIDKLRSRNVDIFIFTRPIEEYDNIIRPQIQVIFERLEEMRVCVYHPGRYIHQKAAIVDREILWEGSLNILAHRGSNEMMRRTVDQNSAMQVLEHLSLNRLLADGYKNKYERMYRELIKNTENISKQKYKILLLGVFIPLIIWLVIMFWVQILS